MRAILALLLVLGGCRGVAMPPAVDAGVAGGTSAPAQPGNAVCACQRTPTG